MAHHKSAKKRIIQNEVKRLHNKYYARTTRNAVRDLKKLTDKDAATKRLPEVVSMLDKLAKINVIHHNKAANLKSAITKYVNQLAV
jgi:small subunit ribosomal protein S20